MDAEFPLTNAQRLFTSRLGTDNISNMMVYKTYIAGEKFNLSLFKKAINHMVLSNPALRLKLVRHDHEWKQMFSHYHPEFLAIEINGNHDESMAYINNLLYQDYAKGFNLTIGSPVRVRVIKFDDKYIVNIFIDHIAIDEFAFNLFEKELIICYEHLLNDTIIPIKSNYEFERFLIRENNTVYKESYNLKYWEEKFKSPPFFADRSKHSVPIKIFYYSVNDDSYKQLLTLCTLYKVSLFNFIVALQIKLLIDLKGYNELLISIVLGNRYKEEENMLMLNMVSVIFVRWKRSENECFSELVQQIRNQMFEGLLYRKYDFSQLNLAIAKELKVNGDAGDILLTECNFFIENEVQLYPNLLFETKLDKGLPLIQVRNKNSIQTWGFKTLGGLRIEFYYDYGCYMITRKELKSKLDNMIAEVCKGDNIVSF